MSDSDFLILALSIERFTEGDSTEHEVPQSEVDNVEAKNIFAPYLPDVLTLANQNSDSKPSMLEQVLLFPAQNSDPRHHRLEHVVGKPSCRYFCDADGVSLRALALHGASNRYNTAVLKVWIWRQYD